MDINTIISILIAFLVFGIVVLVHEFGHFIVAIKNGILVEEFAIGMGPAILKKQKGDTLYSIRILPIGGYCKMLGEDEANVDSRSFNNKSVFARISVIAAGAIMNFILSFVIILILTSVNGFATLTVKDTFENSPAFEAGLQSGDRILKVNNKNVRVFEDLNLILMDTKAQPVDVLVDRNGERVVLNIEPVLNESRYIMGFTMEMKQGLIGSDDAENANFFEILERSFWTLGYYIKSVFWGLKSLVTFNVSMDDMAGPVGIVSLIGNTYQETSQIGIWSTITTMSTLAALISANLGVFNLLPIPALDGGRLLFLFLEGIRKKPVNPEKEGTIHFVGFAMLMLLILFITFNDLRRLFF